MGAAVNISRPLHTGWVLGLFCLTLACDSEFGGSLRQEGGGHAANGGETSLRLERAERDTTVWQSENLAQEYEASLVALWDQLLAADRRDARPEKFRALAALQLGQITLGEPTRSEDLPHGIQRKTFGPPLQTLGHPGWRAWLKKLEAGGYALVQSEWHHARFEPSDGNDPARSQVSIVLHGIHEPSGRRFVIDGPLEVEWAAGRDSRGNPIPARVDATNLQMLSRSDGPAFSEIKLKTSPGGSSPRRLHPLVVYDLDKNGFEDVLLLGAGTIRWNHGGALSEEQPLLTEPYPLAEAGAVADFDGDGQPDLLAPRRSGDIVLYRGDGKGRFPDSPRLTPRLRGLLQGPSSIAVGDIDADGDLDAWLTQYRPPYSGGQMPTPFFDANDGWESHLLINDGKGHFELRTEMAGLGAKRFRRTYASVFSDLDEDGDLDLLVISDFSGVDLYRNDGSGHFSDANATLKEDRHLFGMSGALADYDLDGRLDFFVAGMGSTTARRMEALGLSREDRPDTDAMRMRMAYGNRMYLAGDGIWSRPSFHADIARTGWTWGTSALDFDNDGDPDLFAANGHESGESTKDYCSTFWRHDIFDGDSKPNKSLENLFSEEMSGFTSGRESWDGYQKNSLLMNQSGKAFLNIAFLMGLADEFDSRSAITADLDRDGRVDVLVMEDRGEEGQYLHAYRNELDTENHWIGIELSESEGGPSPVGASIRIRAGERSQIKHVLVGESVMGQHPTTVHFGLGKNQEVQSLEVRWIGGSTRTLRNPEINRYHRVEALAPDPTAPLD